MLPRSESSYRVRTINGARYFTRRQAFGDRTIVVQRFPGPAVEGPSFVLVPGIGVSSRYFGPAAAELAKRGTVYLVDLPGYGAAPDPKRDVTIVDHAGVLAKFLSATELDHPVLVGHSWGSQVTSRLAVDHPGVIDHLVLMAPTLVPAARTFWRSIGLLLRDSLREPWRVRLIATGDYLFRCGIPYGLKQMPYLLGDRIEDRLPAITAKTLVIRGDQDCIVEEAWAREVAALVQGATFETVNGPHVVMYTDPVSVARLIDGLAAR